MRFLLALLVITSTAQGYFTLITSLYNETNKERAEEYITCLQRNLAHPLIDAIHVLYDTNKDSDGSTYVLNFLQSQPIKINYISGRATYQHCFELANQLYPNQHIIVSNGDIYFNDTLHQLINYDLSNKFLALTRWESQKDGSLKKQYGWHGKPLYCSQDVWIFDTPLRAFPNTKINMGILGCDCAIAKQAQLAGLTVFNPCLTIQCCHLHTVNIRHYPHQGYPDFLELEWTHL